MPPSVAIIMRAKNEMPHVERTLQKLNAQSFSAFDLYAVDSGSTDGTLQALEKTACALHQIKPEEYIPGKVLNDAIRQTDHDLIVLLNADAIPLSDQWLEQLISPIADNDADATFSKQVARPDARFIVKYDYERAYSTAKAAPGFFSAVACAFRRSLWTDEPFPETGYAEDARWAAAHPETRFRLIEASAVEHSHDYTLKELARKRSRQARAMGEAPRPGKQAVLCLKELIRDFCFALKKMKLLTVPYNTVYRITIHRAYLHGQKERSFN